MSKILEPVFHEKLLNGQKLIKKFIRDICDSLFFKTRVFLACLTITSLVLCRVKAQILGPDPWV